MVLDKSEQRNKHPRDSRLAKRCTCFSVVKTELYCSICHGKAWKFAYLLIYAYRLYMNFFSAREPVEGTTFSSELASEYLLGSLLPWLC
jgi:hypothetical protein